MALPSNISLITVTGTFIDTQGAAAAGTVTFAPSTTLTDTTGSAIITAEPVTVTLNSAGSFSIVLPCTDNISVRPSPFTYLVTIAVSSATQNNIQISVPSTLGVTVDLSALVPIPQQASAQNGLYVVSVNGMSGSVEVGNGSLPVGPLAVGQVPVGISTTTSQWQYPGPYAYNILNYGAPTDGVSDCTAAIQACMNAAAAAGDPVWIPAGVEFRVSQLTWNTGQVIWGGYAGTYPGEDDITTASILTRLAGTNEHLILVPDGTDYGTLRCIAIDGNKNNNTAGDGFHIADGVSSQECQIILDQCFIHDNPGSNVYLGNNRRANKVQFGVYNYAGSGDGITICGSDNTITSNICGSNARAGICLGSTVTQNWAASGSNTNSIATHVYNNDIYGNLVGIALPASCSEAMIVGNGIDRNLQQGITVYNEYSNTIIGNALSSNSAAANNTYGHIDLASGVGAVVIDGNVFGPQGSGYTNVASYCVVTEPGIGNGVITGNIGTADPDSYATGFLSTAGSNSSPSVMLSKGGGIVQGNNSAQQVFQIRNAAGTTLFSMTNAGSFVVEEGAGAFATDQNVFGSTTGAVANTTLTAVSLNSAVQNLALVQSASQSANMLTLYESNASTVLSYIDSTGRWNGPGGTSSATIVIAASNSSAHGKAGADYVCTGSGDETIINAAIITLSVFHGGRVVLLEGDFNCTGAIVIDQNYVWLDGQGIAATTITCPSSGLNRIAAIVVGSTQLVTNCGVRNLQINASGASEGTPSPGSGHGLAVAGNSFTMENLVVQAPDGDCYHFGQDFVTFAGATTVAAGSNGLALPQATLDVTSTSTLTTGAVIVATASGPAYAQYSGTSGGNQLTGCSWNYPAGATLATGDTVSPVTAMFDLTAFNCYAQFPDPNNGFYFDWTCGDFELAICRCQGVFGGKPDTTGNGNGFLIYGQEIKFVLCHAYGCSGYGMKIGGLTQFTAAQIQVFGGELETNATGGLFVQNQNANNCQVYVNGTQFYGNGIPAVYAASDITFAFGTRDVRITGCTFRKGSSSGATEGNISQNIFMEAATYCSIENCEFDYPFVARAVWIFGEGAGGVDACSYITVRNSRQTATATSSFFVQMSGEVQYCEISGNTTDASIEEQTATSLTPNYNVVRDNTLVPGYDATVTLLGAQSLAFDNGLIPATPRVTFTNKTGDGLYVQGQYGVSTVATLGNGTLRLVPWFAWQPCTIKAVGCEFTSAGDASSLCLNLIYADDGTGYPGSLLINGGSISTGSGNAGTVSTGGTPGVYLNTLSSEVAISPGLYWIGGVIQGVTVTQPTMRTAQFMTEFACSVNTTPATGALAIGYSQGGITGTPPGTFTTSIGANTVGSAPRVVLQLV